MGQSKSVPYSATSSSTIVETGDVNVDNLVPILGVCCFAISLVPDCRDSVGAVSETTLLCFSNKCVCCKPAVEPGSYCKMCFTEFDIDPFTTFLSVSQPTLSVFLVYINQFLFSQSRSQVACLDCRSAIPNNEKLPCVITLAALTVRITALHCTDIAVFLNDNDFVRCSSSYATTSSVVADV